MKNIQKLFFLTALFVGLVAPSFEVIAAGNKTEAPSKAGGSSSRYLKAGPVVTGRIVSIDCIDREATIQNEWCQTSKVVFATTGECDRHEFGDIIQVWGEKIYPGDGGPGVIASRVGNLGLPSAFSGTITSISCVDERIEVESCGQTCQVAIEEEVCRQFKYGDKVEIEGEDVNRNTGCVEYAESIRKQGPPSKPPKKGPKAGSKAVKK